jgi:hypothetical protein
MALRHRPAAEYRYCLATFDVAELCAHITGREDVRQEQHLFVTQSAGNFDRPDIRVRDTQVLGLATGKPAEKIRVSEQARGRMTPKFGGLLCIRIGSFATREVATLAEEALAAGDGEWHDDTVAYFELADAAPHLDNFSHRLVAQHVVRQLECLHQVRFEFVRLPDALNTSVPTLTFVAHV